MWDVRIKEEKDKFDENKAHPSGTLWWTRGVRTAVPEGYAFNV